MTELDEKKPPKGIIDKIEAWDQRVFLRIYHTKFAKKINKFAKIYSFFGNAIFWAVIGVFIFIIGYFIKDYFLFQLFFGGYIQSIALFLVLRYGFFDRRRPYLKLKEHGVEKHDDIIRESRSFPSGHTTFFIFYGILFSVYFESWILLIIFTGLGILMGMSRLLLGMHFPSDVITGFTAGILFAILYLGLTYPFWIFLQESIMRFLSPIFY